MDVSASPRQDALRARHASLPGRACITCLALACCASGSRFEGGTRHRRMYPSIPPPCSTISGERSAGACTRQCLPHPAVVCGARFTHFGLPAHVTACPSHGIQEARSAPCRRHARVSAPPAQICGMISACPLRCLNTAGVQTLVFPPTPGPPRRPLLPAVPLVPCPKRTLHVAACQID